MTINEVPIQETSKIKNYIKRTIHSSYNVSVIHSLLTKDVT